MLFVGINTLPNWLTILRVLIVPLIIAIFYLPTSWLTLTQQGQVATLLFTMASLTDWLDGWIARRYGMGSAFGEFLDPVADKLLVCSTLIALVALGRVSPFIALIIVGREIAISALREWMALLNHRVRVSQMGKVKTTLQFLGIGFLLYSQTIWTIPGQWIILVGNWLMNAAAFITVVSMLDYLYQASKVMPQVPPAKRRELQFFLGCVYNPASLIGSETLRHCIKLCPPSAQFVMFYCEMYIPR